MAKKNDNGLYLPLRVDLEAWEASLASLDGPLLEKMRMLRSEMKDLTMEYDVKISNAKAAGDSVKALELEFEKLNEQQKLQESTVKGLNEAYEKSVTETGKYSAQSKELLKNLQQQQIALNKTKQAINDLNAAQRAKRDNEAARLVAEQQKAEAERLAAAKKAEAERLALEKRAEAERLAAAKRAGVAQESVEKKLLYLKQTNYQRAIQQISDERDAYIKAGADKAKADKLFAEQKAQIDAEFNKSSIAKLNDELKMLSPTYAAITRIGSTIASVVKSTGALGVAASGAVATFLGMRKITDILNETAEAAGKANEPIYQLREELNTSYEEAERLHGIMQMDGIAGETFAQTINKLNKQLLKAGENGNLASDMLTRFGAELRNQDGSRKSTIEQLQELSEAYKRAASVGAGRDFLTATGTAPLVHILADLDGYTERWERIRVEYKKDYDASHALMEANNGVIESERQLATVKGEVFTGQALKNKENEIRANVAEAEIIKKNRDSYLEYAKTMGDIAETFTKAKLTASVFWKELVLGAKDALSSLEPVADAVGWVWDKLKPVLKYAGPGFTAFDFLSEKWKKASEEAEKYYQEAKKAVDVKPKKDFKERDPEAEREADKQAAAAEKKAADAQLSLSKALQAAKQSDYENDIQRIADERDEYIKAGADKLQADELYAIKKAAIDSKYAEKAASNKDVEKAKQAQSQITAVFQTETERRIAEIERQRDAWIKAGADEVEATKAAQAQIREARMSEAERTLQQRAKLIKRAQVEMAKGGDWEGRMRSWADDEYIRGLGVNRKDIAWAQRYGFDKINELGNARERVLGSIVGGGGVTNNNNTTVNIDRPVLTDESLINQLVDRVADKLVPVAEKAFGQSANAY